MTPRTTWKRLLLASVLSTAAAVAQAQDSITIKFADQFPLTHIASRIGSQPFKAELEERSGGRIKVQHFPAEQIAKAAGLLDAVRNRVTDIALVGVVYNTDKLPLTSGAELPGLYNDSVMASRAFDAFLKEDLTEREYLPLGIRPLWGTVTPPYQMMFSEVEAITDMSEMKGKKMRVAGATGELIAQALGAVPVKVPASDLYLALQRGTVNGAIYNPPSVFGYKIEEVLSSVSNNATLGSVAFALLVNEDVWNGLSEEDRALIAETASDVREDFSRLYEEDFQKSYETLAGMGVNIFSLPPEAESQMTEMLGSVIDTWVQQVSARGLPAQEMLDKFTARLGE